MQLKILLDVHKGYVSNAPDEAIFAIHQNIEVEIFSSLKDAINSNPKYIIITSIKGKLKSYYSDYYFTSLNFQIYDSKGCKTTIREGRWECIEIDEPVSRSVNEHRVYRLKDPKGKIISFLPHDLTNWLGDGISGACTVIKILGCLRPYSSWEEVELKLENEKLLKENQALKEKIKKLE